MVIIRCSDSEKSLTLGFFIYLFFFISVKLKKIFFCIFGTLKEKT